MDLTTARLATSAEAAALLSSIDDAADPLALSTRLRAQGHAPDLVAAVITQATLRGRGRAKWPDADELVLTPDGVEQATRAELAALHARRFVDAGVPVVRDLGCGIGSDARAFAQAGLQVEAVDADEATALLAAHNLRGLPATVRVGYAEDAVVGPEEGVWLDPARRTPGIADITGRTKRVFRLDDISPTWEQVQRLAAQGRAAGAKLSPAFPYAALPPGCEAQWTSFDGEVLECVVWWGTAVRTTGRTATVVARDGSAVTLTEAECGPGVGGSTYLYEADRAVIRAGLVGALERAVDGVELDPGTGYVASDAATDLAWARRYRVLDRMPVNVKAFRAWCRAHDVTRLTIKRRGDSPDPEAFRRELRLKGKGAEATIVLTSEAGRRTLLVVEPT